MAETSNDQSKYMDEEPEKLLPYFNPFDILLQLLSEYGWWFIGGSIIGLWLYSKLKPSISQFTEDALHKKDPDIEMKRMEGMEAARQRQQQAMEAAAREYKLKEEERLAKKRQEYIERNDGKGGNRLGSKSEYLPLCGSGPSGGYKAPKKKCPGGGCGK